MTGHADKLTTTAVVVVRNGEQALPGALACIDQQTRHPERVLLVDGQSTDRTAEIAQSHQGVDYVLQPDLGLAAARNLAIQRCDTDVIAFLDHDDRWAPNKLERQLSELETRPDLGYVTCLLRRCRTDASHRAFDQLDGDIVPGSTPSALVARLALFETVGDFDPSLRIGCDADWFARARDHGVPSAVLDDVLVDKLLHDRNLSSDATTNQREMLMVVRRSLQRKRAADGPPS